MCSTLHSTNDTVWNKTIYWPDDPVHFIRDYTARLFLHPHEPNLVWYHSTFSPPSACLLPSGGRPGWRLPEAGCSSRRWVLTHRWERPGMLYWSRVPQDLWDEQKGIMESSFIFIPFAPLPTAESTVIKSISSCRGSLGTDLDNNRGTWCMRWDLIDMVTFGNNPAFLIA